MSYCSQCGTPRQPGVQQCYSCGAAFEPSPFQLPPQAEMERIPFEERKKLGFWFSLFQTWKLASFNPARFYPLVGKSSDTTSAIFFFLINGTISVIIWGGLRFFAMMLIWPFLSVLREKGINFPMQFSGEFYFLAKIFSSVISVIFAPLLLFITLFFMAVIHHFFLLIVRGAPRGFSVTLNTLAYASAPNVIPLIGWIWSSTLIVMALAYAHSTQFWRPVAAIMLEFFVFVAVVIVPLVLLAFAVFHRFPHTSPLSL